MDKYDHIVRDFYPSNPHKVFYPVDRYGKHFEMSAITGVVDEWDALVKNQTYLEEQAAQRKAAEEKARKLQYK